MVKWFDADEGWGVIDAPQVPGGRFVHFSGIQMPGHRHLDAGQHVRFTFEQPGFLQDGCPYRPDRCRVREHAGHIVGLGHLVPS